MKFDNWKQFFLGWSWVNIILYSTVMSFYTMIESNDFIIGKWNHSYIEKVQCTIKATKSSFTVIFFSYTIIKYTRFSKYLISNVKPPSNLYSNNKRIKQKRFTDKHNRSQWSLQREESTFECFVALVISNLKITYGKLLCTHTPSYTTQLVSIEKKKLL